MEFDDGEPGPVLDGIPFADDETANPAGSKSGADVPAAARTTSPTEEDAKASLKAKEGEEDNALTQFLLDLKLDDDECDPVVAGIPLAPTPESIRRHTDISFPARVNVGKSYSLRVQIIPAEETLPTGEIKELPKPHPHDVTMSLYAPKPAQPEEPPPAIRVTIDVTAENFEIEGMTSAEIIVPLRHKSLAAKFRLRGKEVGPGRIMIDFVQAGRPVGSVDLFPEVVERRSRGHEGTCCNGRGSEPRNGPRASRLPT